MKKITFLSFVLVGLFLCQSNLLIGQDVYKKMSGVTCDCLSNKDLNPSQSEAFELAIGLCVLEAYSQHEEEAKQAGIDFNSDNAASELGEKLAVYLMTDCPAFMTYIFQYAMEEDDWGEDSGNEVGESISGKFVKIKKSGIAKVIVKGKNGDSEELYWIAPFNNSEELMDNAKEYKNKKVTVGYVKTEVYDAKRNRYLTVKQIVSFE